MAYNNTRFTKKSNSGFRYSSRKQSTKKRSGAKMGVIKTGKSKGKHYISGWNANKARGFMTLFAAPMTAEQLKAKRELNGLKSSEYGLETKSDTGRTYERWSYTIRMERGGEVKQGVAFFDVVEQKLRVPAFNMVANPRAYNGGYFGKSGKPKS